MKADHFLKARISGGAGWQDHANFGWFSRRSCPRPARHCSTVIIASQERLLSGSRTLKYQLLTLELGIMVTAFHLPIGYGRFSKFPHIENVPQRQSLHQD
jgi:hypothetical protein